MKILADGTICIETRNELPIVKQYVELKKLDTFKLKVGTLGTQDRVDLEKHNKSGECLKIYAENRELLKKVVSLDLYHSVDDYNIISYCENLQYLSLPNTEDDAKIVKPFINNNERIKSLNLSDTSLLDIDLKMKRVEKLSISQCNYINKFIINEGDVISLDNSIFNNFPHLKEIKFCHIPKFYAFNVLNENLESISLIGNYNLKRVCLPKDLGNIKTLRIYSNNKDCDFDAWKIAQIIRANVKGENKLQKLVFGMFLYPAVVKILENDLKDAKFKAVFDKLVYVGDVVESMVNEIDAKTMQTYDKVASNVIKSCGVQKTDNEYIAFAKIYLFVLLNCEYNRKIFKNGMREKLSACGAEVKHLDDGFELVRMLGNGFNASKTFGAFDGDFKIICAGYSRLLKYLLCKVGIASEEVLVFSGKKDEVALNRQKNLASKKINRMILKVFLGNGAIYADATNDTSYLTGKKVFKESFSSSLSRFSFFNVALYTQIVDIFTECPHYNAKCKGLSEKELLELYNAFLIVRKNINNGKTKFCEDDFKCGNALDDWKMLNDYKADNDYLQYFKDKMNIDDYLAK